MRSAMLLAMTVLVPCCAPAPAPDVPVGDGFIPRGAINATVRSADDRCALQRPELMEGHTLGLLIGVPPGPGDEAGVQVSVPGSRLPSLSAPTHQMDIFRTDSYNTPITAFDGMCQAQRSQHYEGHAAGDREYLVLFRSQDTMPTGVCGVTPIPCETVVTLSLPYCSPRACPQAAQ